MRGTVLGTGLSPLAVLLCLAPALALFVPSSGFWVSVNSLALDHYLYVPGTFTHPNRACDPEAVSGYRVVLPWVVQGLSHSSSDQRELVRR